MLIELYLHLNEFIFQVCTKKNSLFVFVFHSINACLLLLFVLHFMYDYSDSCEIFILYFPHLMWFPLSQTIGVHLAQEQLYWMTVIFMNLYVLIILMLTEHYPW